jgi:hypothetical protein
VIDNATAYLEKNIDKVVLTIDKAEFFYALSLA